VVDTLQDYTADSVRLIRAPENKVDRKAEETGPFDKAAEARSLSHTGSHRQEFANESGASRGATTSARDMAAEARSLSYTGSYRQEFATKPSIGAAPLQEAKLQEAKK
jgi:hypothetical protein